MPVISTDLAVWLVKECISQQEPCVPDSVGEPWVSVRFAAQVLGFEEVTFLRKINKLGIPRHPVQQKCIRLSDLAEMGNQ